MYYLVKRTHKYRNLVFIEDSIAISNDPLKCFDFIENESFRPIPRYDFDSLIVMPIDDFEAEKYLKSSCEKI